MGRRSKNNSNKHNTLAAYHKKKIDTFDNQKDMKKNKNKLKSYKKEFDKINKKSVANCTDDEIRRKKFLMREIKCLEKIIENKTNQVEKSNYLLSSMDLLEQYYSKEDIIQEETDNSILDFLTNKNKKVSNNLMDFVQVQNIKSKKNIYDEYLTTVESKPIEGKLKYNINDALCEHCGEEKVLNYSEALYICHNCGLCDYTLIESEKPAYQENVIENCNYSYKRFLHFSEWLNKFQGLETTTIKDEVYDQIKKEIKKQRITNLKNIDHVKMKAILKKLKLTKYYDHVFHIINKINNMPPPRLSKEVEDNLKNMFKKIQEPFAKFCPNDRTNFLSYSYVIRKFLELIDQTEYVQYFPLLKSREKLYQQDMMWKSICFHLGWHFNPSI